MENLSKLTSLIIVVLSLTSCSILKQKPEVIEVIKYKSIIIPSTMLKAVPIPKYITEEQYKAMSCEAKLATQISFNIETLRSVASCNGKLSDISNFQDEVIKKDNP